MSLRPHPVHHRLFRYSWLCVQQLPDVSRETLAADMMRRDAAEGHSFQMLSVDVDVETAL